MVHSVDIPGKLDTFDLNYTHATPSRLELSLCSFCVADQSNSRSLPSIQSTGGTEFDSKSWPTISKHPALTLINCTWKLRTRRKLLLVTLMPRSITAPGAYTPGSTCTSICSGNHWKHLHVKYGLNFPHTDTLF